MEAKQSTAKWWLWFIIWTVIAAIFFVYKRDYFWLTLPGFFTYFVKAMNIM